MRTQFKALPCQQSKTAPRAHVALAGHTRSRTARTNTPAGPSGYTVGDYLLDRLAELGVGEMFGVPGDFNLEFLDHVLAHEEISWVGGANELNAGYAADGYARVRGMAALLTTFGVGELSAANAIAGSYAERVPVVHIVGAPPTKTQAAGKVVHHSLGDGDFGRFFRMAREITCAQAALTADTATSEIDRVLMEVRDEQRPGYLVLASDVARFPAEPPVTALPVRETETCPRALSLFTRAAAELIADHQVTVLADGLVQRRQAVHRLTELLNADAIPFATLMSGKSLVDESSPNFLGVYSGATSAEPVRRAIEEAPVLVTAGVVFTDVNSGFFTHVINAARTVDIGATQSSVAGEVFGPIDMHAALEALTSIVAGRGIASPPPSTTWFEEDGDQPEADSVLTQEVLWDNVSRMLTADCTVLADQGTSYYGMVRHRLPSGATFIGQPLWASIGYTLPAALGASLADRERRTVLLVGDGAAQLTVQELGVMAREVVAPVIVLVNNNGYTIERAIHGPDAAYNDIVAWRWPSIPAALGVTNHISVTARTCGELSRALAEAVSQPERMAFIEVVLPADDVPPLLSELAHSAGAANAAQAAASHPVAADTDAERHRLHHAETKVPVLVGA